MARMLTFKQSINEALAQEMARDETVSAMGEDIVGGMGGDGEMDAWGGVFGGVRGQGLDPTGRLAQSPLLTKTSRAMQRKKRRRIGESCLDQARCASISI